MKTQTTLHSWRNVAAPAVTHEISARVLYPGQAVKGVAVYGGLRSVPVSRGRARSGWVWKGIVKTAQKNRITELGDPTNGAESSVEMQQPYRVLVELVGVCPLLFHRWNNESVEAKSKAKKGSIEKKTDDTESFMWKDEHGYVSIPGEYVRQSVIHASKYEQDPRSPRKSMMDLMKAALVSLTELASLGVKEPDYYDRRRVVIMRSAVTRTRPAMKEGWKAKFILMINLPEYCPPQRLNHLLQQAGRIIGLADFRPSFGRFNVTQFKVLDD
jgi:hypothetical protein